MNISDAINELIESVLLAHSSGDPEELKDSHPSLYEAINVAETFLTNLASGQPMTDQELEDLEKEQTEQ